MKIEHTIWKDQKELKCGYTTGSCAAAAAKAATRMLLSGEEMEYVSLQTPKGIRLYLEVEEIEKTKEYVSCAIRKDSGDDPDVTDGILIFAKVWKNEDGILKLDGGTGVGRVTQKGLQQKIGEAAINEVPRNMILEAVQDVRTEFGEEAGLTIEISAPKGVEIAKKTFNPRLGIQGGISILGTSGIVEPMSEKALLETIFLEMKMLKENGINWCYIVPGNYGMEFLEGELQYQKKLAVKCSNFIGEAIDMAVRLQMEGILLIGHIGKFVKLSAGIMNTHSKMADARMEVIGVHAAMNGADPRQVQKIMDCPTTKEAIQVLKDIGILKSTMNSIMLKIEEHLKYRTGDTIPIGAMMFSLEDGMLGMTSEAEWINKKVQEQDICKEVFG